jgi:predicted small lipoprotein YifL
MRTLLRALFCAVVIGVIAGCGGGGETYQKPAKFTPAPEKGAQPVVDQGKGAPAPLTLPKKGGPKGG